MCLAWLACHKTLSSPSAFSQKPRPCSGSFLAMSEHEVSSISPICVWELAIPSKMPRISMSLCSRYSDCFRFSSCFCACCRCFLFSSLRRPSSIAHCTILLRHAVPSQVGMSVPAFLIHRPSQPTVCAAPYSGLRSSIPLSSFFLCLPLRSLGNRAASVCRILKRSPQASSEVPLSPWSATYTVIRADDLWINDLHCSFSCRPPP